MGSKHVVSMIELRRAQVVRQQWDLTCGAAAIATVMTYQLGRPVTERQVTLAMLRQTSPLLVRMRLGFSLLDLKRYASTQGLEASGYGELGLDDVVGMAPVIVPIRSHGFRHFVVLRGRLGDRLLLADPAFGNRTVSLDTFEAEWANHLGFTVVDPSQPHPPNRMDAPTRLFATPNGQTLRTAAAEIDVRPRP
ncbi:MAG TPA: C39 family peptidase [Caulobacteraceae bacterium]